MKIFAVFVLVLTGLVPTHADTTQTQTWNVAASCQLGDSAAGFPCVEPSVINAVFTTQMETGLFALTSDPTIRCIDPCPAPVVTDISGTFDGLPMTLIGESGSPFNWLLVSCNPTPTTCGAIPEGVSFIAGGNQYLLWYDGSVFLTNQSPFSIEVMNWSAVESVPEPPLFWLLLTALSFLGLSRWAQLSLRKYSVH